MKRSASTLLAGLLLSTSGAAFSEISGNVTLATDYAFRGVSQTDNQMALQGGFDWAHDSGFYVGTWASNVAPSFFLGPTDPQLEVDLYAGYSGEAGGFGYDLGVARYNYPGASDSNTTEIYVGGSYGLSDSVSASATFYYSNELNFVAVPESAWYLDLGAEAALPRDVTLAAHIGFSDGDAYDPTKGGLASDYVDYSIGVSKEIGGLGLDLTLVDTNDDGATAFGKSVTDSRVIFSVSKSL